MKKLHARWGAQVQFVDVLIRQAHPGPRVEAYGSFGDKLADARAYQREEGIPWIVAADDLEGTAHQVYGGLSDPLFLIDVDGRVAFYNMWAHPPTMHGAIAELLANEGHGVVCGGYERQPHMLAAFTDGWRAIERGRPRSVQDLWLAAPGSPVLLWLGYQLKPLLRPVALRGKPLPPGARLALAAGTALAFGGMLAASRR